MSVPNLMTALSNGFNAQQIIQWLTNNHKALSKHIKSAKTQGYSDDQILTYLTKGKYASHGQKNEMLSGMTEQEKGTRITNAPTNLQPLAKGLGTAAMVGGTALAASRAIPAIAKAIPQIAAVGKNLFSGAPQVAPGPKPMSNAPTAAPPISTQEQIPPSAESALPSPEIQQMASATSPMSNILKELNVENQIRNLVEAGNNPETVGKAVNFTLNPEQKKMVRERVKSGEIQSLEEEIGKHITKQKEGEKTPEKGVLVATPSGNVGHVKDVRKTEALIDEDGKTQKIKLADAFEIPEEVANKDFNKIALEYISKFPEKGPGSLSEALSVLAHNPDDNRLYTVYPDSPNWLYIHMNVPSELYQKIISASTAPKTSGGTGLPGTWDVNTADSRGSPYREITENPEKYPYIRIPIGYDMMDKLKLAIKEMRKIKRRKPRG